VNLDVFTLFPQWFDWFGEQRHVSNALALGHTFEAVDLRATTPLKWGQVDDTPFGGGAGMVLRVDVMEAALRARYGGDPAAPDRRVIALTPGGRLLDERILEHFCTDQVSIGRYVLAGGELAAMVVADTVLRKLPGVLGKDESAVEESFSPALDGGLEYPHYTRPAEWRGWSVPEVLLSGHHERIREWRREQSRQRSLP
jgi:tRNA (guanine37-N1)-methyltransferase